jgi:hypothetical protein
MEHTKITFNLPNNELEELKALAARRGWTMTTTIRRSLGLQVFVSEEEDKGNRLLIKQPDGTLQLVTIK